MLLQKIKQNRGFTLIELLIVIVIIGILGSIILQSLSNSRTRAYDSKIKQQLRNFQTTAEIYSNANENKYSVGVVNSCTNPGTIFTDTTPSNGTPGSHLVFTGFPIAIGLECNANITTYAVQAKFIGPDYWCVDSRGISKIRTTTLGSATQCL